MSHDTLADLGWDGQFEEQFASHSADGFEPGRVAVQHRGAYDVYIGHDQEPVPGTVTGDCPWESVPAELTGRLRFDAVSPLDLPAVGDWVALRTAPGGGWATIHAVLPRRTAFVRKAASAEQRRTEEQVVAANVDVVFIVTGLDGDLNPRRLERYLVLAWESGAEPVVVLTKADLCDDVPGRAAEVEPVALGVPVHVVSNVTGDGLDGLRAYFSGCRTVAALGSSGVGKSTLLNRLVGEELQATGDVRRDGRGRHTTTRRELLPMPGGGLFLDTPGMRELQLWEAPAGVDEAFGDIADLVARCRFADCSHEHEPGCGVLAALDRGELDPERLEGYRKLTRELERLERKLDGRAQSEYRRAIRKRARARRRASW